MKKFKFFGFRKFIVWACTKKRLQKIFNVLRNKLSKDDAVFRMNVLLNLHNPRWGLIRNETTSRQKRKMEIIGLTKRWTINIF